MVRYIIKSKKLSRFALDIWPWEPKLTASQLRAPRVQRWLTKELKSFAYMKC